MSTDVKFEDGHLIVSRVYDAPRELVFEAWVETSKVQQWWGCAECTSVRSEIDLEVGGRYNHHMTIAGAGEVPGFRHAHGVRSARAFGLHVRRSGRLGRHHDRLGRLLGGGWWNARTARACRHPGHESRRRRRAARDRTRRLDRGVGQARQLPAYGGVNPRQQVTDPRRRNHFDPRHRPDRTDPSQSRPICRGRRGHGLHAKLVQGRQDGLPIYRAPGWAIQGHVQVEGLDARGRRIGREGSEAL